MMFNMKTMVQKFVFMFETKISSLQNPPRLLADIREILVFWSLEAATVYKSLKR